MTIQTVNHKTRRKKRAYCAAVLLLCISFVLCLCSCASQRELNTLAIVVATGLDAGEQPGTLKLTAQVVKASEMGSGSSAKNGGSEGKAYINIKQTEKSILSAVREITRMESRRLYFAHNNVLIFGHDMAKRDMSEGLDAFARDYEARMNVYILIAKGSASEILDEDVELEKVPAFHISDMMEGQTANSETVVVTLRDFIIATLLESAAPVAPMIKVYEVEGKKRAKLEGSAIFKKEKLVGELDKSQTRGFLFVTDKVKSSALTLDTQWGQIVVEINRSKSALKPVKTADGQFQMQLDIHVNGIVQSNETNEKISSLENIEIIKGKVKEAIRSDIEGALTQARELSADIFGFGELIHRKYPGDWEKMRKEWEEIFPGMALDIQMEVELRSTGSLSEPLVPGGVE